MNEMKKLYKIAGIATIIIVILIPIQILLFGLYPPPDTPKGFFELYNENWLLVDISVKLTHQYGDTDPPQTGSIFKNHLA